MSSQKPSESNGPDHNTSNLTPEEKLLYEKYGKVPNKKDMLNHKLKERKYFDSGDYAMYKAGKASGPGGVGSIHPSPDMIPHSNPNSNHVPSNPHQMKSMNPDGTLPHAKNGKSDK